MEGAYRAGVVDKTTMREFDAMCLTAVEELPYRFGAVREVGEEAAATLDVQDLLPIGHWVTPENESRRYDTRFYLSTMPPDQVARHDEGETTELRWLTPGDAIAQCARGDILLAAHAIAGAV